MGVADGGDAPTRVAWIDVARGISIVMVVVHHSISYGRYLRDIPAWLAHLNVALAALVIPLFFFVSGIVSVRLRTMSLAELVGRRLAVLMYLFFLWSLVRVGFVHLLEAASGTELENARPVWHWLIKPPDTLWFVYALALFSAFAWALRRRRVGVTVVAAAVLFLVTLLPVPPALGFAVRALRLLPWFCLGIWLAPRLTRVEQSVHGAALLFPLAWLATAYLTLGVDGARGVAVMLAFTLTALPAGVVAAVMLARTPLSRPLRYVGRNTIPIYVMHVLVIIAGRVVNRAFEAPLTELAVTFALALTLPLLVQRVALRHGGWFLFVPPLPRRARRVGVSTPEPLTPHG